MKKINIMAYTYHYNDLTLKQMQVFPHWHYFGVQIICTTYQGGGRVTM